MSTEDEIIEATLRLISNRTTFIIAHRLRTLRNCNIILILSNGRLVRITENPKDLLRDLTVDEEGQWTMREPSEADLVR